MTLRTALAVLLLGSALAPAASAPRTTAPRPAMPGRTTLGPATIAPSPLASPSPMAATPPSTAPPWSRQPATAPPPSPAEDLPSVALPADLARVLRDYERAWSGGDAKALAALFTEDGFLLQPNRLPARGRAEIEQRYRGQGGGPLRLRALAWAAEGRVGYIIGAYGYGDTPGDMGKFTLTLRRSDGRWLIVSDMDNGNGARVGAVQPAGSHSTSTLPARIALVTGSTDGLGRELARRLAAEGAHVIVHGRNADRGRALVEEITAAGKGSARFYQADFAALAEVRRFADEIARDYPRLDLLVNNAGIFLRDERQVSADGHELTFAVNYLAGYLLTHRLVPLLEKGRAPRIVHVSSRSAAPIDFADVMLERGYTGYRAYSQSKLAQVMFTIDLAADLRAQGIVVHAVHPATGMDTTLIRTAGLTARTGIDEGADAVMHVIRTDAPSGSYFLQQSVATPHAQSADVEARRQLREVSQRLTGVP